MHFFSRCFILLLSAFILGTASCGSPKVDFNSPESVAKAYLEAMSKLDFDKAKTYCTQSTAEMMDMIKMLMGVMEEKERKEMEAESKKLKIKKVTCETMSATTRECRYCCNEEGNEDEAAFMLVREGNKWLVDIPKEDNMQEGETPSED
jgi:hypothetical protein